MLLVHDSGLGSVMNDAPDIPIDGPTNDEILAGGWNPKYARVLRVEVSRNVAVALVDGNGDGAEIEMEHWWKVEGRWRYVSSTGFGSLDGPGESLGMRGDVDGGRLVWAAGHSQHPEVAVQFKGARHAARVDQFGVWLWIAHDDDEESEELPIRVGRD